MSFFQLSGRPLQTPLKSKEKRGAPKDAPKVREETFRFRGVSDRRVLRRQYPGNRPRFHQRRP
jgi:hypothetical protein